MSDAEDVFDDAVLAGEYVIGVLDAEARHAVGRRLKDDAEFAALVQFWERKFSPLALSLNPVAPPAALKQRIMKTLFAEPARRERSFAGALAFWRLATAGMTALAMTAIAALVYQSTRPLEIVETQLYATILPADAEPVLSARIDNQLRMIEIDRAAIELADNQAAELWLIPADGTPRSLGLINSEGRDRVGVPARLRSLFNAGAVLAVSLEPLGGSPTGAPTGPIIGLGELNSN
ncbi:MAG: anti-sigma factor [Pseudomonadota bacterium]